MKKIWKRLICLALLAVLCLSEGLALADGSGKLTITIGDKDSPFDRKGIQIALYKVGSEVAQNDLQLDAPFSGITLRNGMTAQDMEDILKAIREVLIAQDIKPTKIIETDENGKASTGDLDLGIYYGIPTELPQWLSVRDFLITVPQLAPGIRNLDVDADLKHSYVTPTPSPSPTPSPTPSPSPTPTLVPPVAPPPPPKEDTDTPVPETTTAVPTMTPRPTPGPTPGPHRLIIHYIYADSGEPASPDHNEILYEGERYDVWSPIIPNYWYDIPEVFGVMPNHDMEYTVLYYKKKPGWRYITLEDYETALGIGMIQMHVGVCYE